MKRMTYKELQEKLNKEKWLKSEQEGKDLTAYMEWCLKCPFQRLGTCMVSQEDRDNNRFCAIAYRAMEAKERKNAKNK